ncbi:MAG: glycosyltransferase [Candidatus Yanofskybacteria bacterium]|nr:glycosyltransferase [Candidatus Yanofskybacteria bacterium]
MKIALVHDWLNSLGGAERVLIELHKIFPDAPIYTLFYDKKFKAEHLLNAEVRPSYLQKFPLITSRYKLFAILMPSAVESFDLSDFDVVISSSAFFSKGLILRPKTRHICYCYSPTRQLWDLSTSNKQQATSDKLAKHLLRLWDRQAADRVDEFIAISETVRLRIQKYYKQDSKIIYPPVPELPEGDSDRPIEKEYYLIVSRLFPHKNIDTAIDVFNKLGFELVIIGDGPEYKNLKSQISNHKQIRMFGHLDDRDVATYYRHAKAFIMSQEEDFGLTPIEAMQFGVPTLALRKGGALETIREGITGEFFDDPIPEALADGIRRLNENYRNYRPELIKSRAKQFSADIFKKQILELVPH